MLKLPKKEENSKGSRELCECRPVCRNRRRQWRGEILQTSAELLAEKERRAEGVQKPCFKKLEIRSLYTRKAAKLKICEAPIATSAPTPYLEFAKLAKRLGAWDTVRSKCAFCACLGCCLCSDKEYGLKDEDSEHRRAAMRDFDRRVKSDCRIMRIMYNKALEH